MIRTPMRSGYPSNRPYTVMQQNMPGQSITKSFETWKTEAGISPGTALFVGGLTPLPPAVVVVVAVGPKNSGPKEEGQKGPRNRGWRAKH